MSDTPLHHQQIKEINESLLHMYYHPLGGHIMPGELIGLMYEKHGISDHGFENNKWYQLHVAESTKGWYVLTSETENPNVTKD